MVYLIHFHRRIGNHTNPRGQAQHYLGYASRLWDRMTEHEVGNGAAIMAYLAQQGIGWSLVRTWDGGRKLERKLKNRKNASHLCPICRKARKR